MSPRSQKQFEELREVSIRKILDASLELFGTKGFEATSIAMIARRAGISKGLIYNYFDSKEDLLKGMIEDLSKEGDQLMEDMQADDPRQMMENIIRFTFDWFRKNDRLNRLILGLSTQIGRFQFVHDMANGKMKHYVVLLENLLREIGFSDYKTEALILATIFDGVALQYMVMKEDYPLDEMEARLVEKYCRK